MCISIFWVSMRQGRGTHEAAAPIHRSSGGRTKSTLCDVTQHFIMANPFTAEQALLSSLAAERISARKEAAAAAPPRPAGAGLHFRAIPPLSERQLATGEVASLPGYGRHALAVSSTGHAGIKEMQLARRAGENVHV